MQGRRVHGCKTSSRRRSHSPAGKGFNVDAVQDLASRASESCEDVQLPDLSAPTEQVARLVIDAHAGLANLTVLNV